MYILTIFIILLLQSMDEIKSLIENDISKLKEMVQEKSEEQERLLQRILSSVEKTNNSSLVQGNTLKSMKLKKPEMDDLGDSYNSTDDNTFPLLPQ